MASSFCLFYLRNIRENMVNPQNPCSNIFIHLNQIAETNIPRQMVVTMERWD